MEWWKGKAAQRPKVEKQQNERQSNEHGLAHQAQGEQEQSEEVIERGWRMEDGGGRLEFQVFGLELNKSHVCQERQHKEESTQHIFPLRHPGHRFDMQRVKGEQGSNHRAAPLR